MPRPPPPQSAGVRCSTPPSRNAEFRSSFSIFFYNSTGVFMFDLLLLFRCFPEVGRGRFALFSVIFISWRWLFPMLGGG
jgi:hypothetical protein